MFIVFSLSPLPSFCFSDKLKPISSSPDENSGNKACTSSHEENSKIPCSNYPTSRTETSQKPTSFSIDKNGENSSKPDISFANWKPEPNSATSTVSVWDHIKNIDLNRTIFLK